MEIASSSLARTDVESKEDFAMSEKKVAALHNSFDRPIVTPFAVGILRGASLSAARTAEKKVASPKSM
jgi:hypothetical protein